MLNQVDKRACVVLSAYVTTLTTEKEMARRLQEIARKHGAFTAKELAEKIQEIDPDAKLGGIRRHWDGRSIPSTRYCIAYAERFGCSVDWLLFGKEPVAPEFNQLRSLADWLIAAIGGEEAAEAYDPVLRELVKIAKVLEPTDLGFLKSMAEKLQDRKGRE